MEDRLDEASGDDDEYDERANGVRDGRGSQCRRGWVDKNKSAAASSG